MAPAFVQGTSQPSSGSSNSAVPFNCAFSSSVTAGNLMVVAIGGDDSTQQHPTGDHTTWSITDTLGSTWHLRGTGRVGSGTYYTQVWDAIVPAGGGANTIHWNSGTTPGATFARILIHELSGVDTLDNATVVNSGGINNSAVGSITIANAVEYIFAWLLHNAGLSSISSPFTLLETSTVEMTAGLTTSSAGTYTPTGVASGNDYSSVIAAGYYLSGGGPPAVSATAASKGASTAAITAATRLSPSAASVSAATATISTGPPAVSPTARSIGAATATITTPSVGLTPVQTKNSTMVISAGTTGTISFTSNVTAGNSIVVLLGWETFTLTGTDLRPITVTDNHGNTYNVEMHETEAPNFRGVGMAKADHVAAGATTLTITCNATGYVAAALVELPPCLSMSANGAGSTVSAVGPISTGSFTMLDGGLVLTQTMCSNAVTDPVDVTVPSGYTGLGTASVFPTGNNAGFAGSYGANAVDGGVNVTWNLNQTMDRATVAAWCLVPVTEVRPRLIQTAVQPSSGGSTITTYAAVLPNMAVEKGNRIIVALGGSDQGTFPNDYTSWTITDDQGNTYHKDAEVFLAGHYLTQVWSAIAAKSAQTTVTWNSGTAGVQFARLAVHDVFNASDGVDNSQTNTGLSATLSGSVNATQNNNEYLFAWLVHNASVISINAPWVQVQYSTGEPTAQYIPGATGTYTVSAPATTADTWCVSTVSYYRSTAAPGPSLAATASGVSAATALISAPSGLASSAASVSAAAALITSQSPLSAAAASSVSAATATVTAPLFGGPVAIAVSASSISAATVIVQAGAPQLLPSAGSVSAARATISTPARFSASAQGISRASADVGTGGLVHLHITPPKTLSLIGYSSSLESIQYDTTLQIMIG